MTTSLYHSKLGNVNVGKILHVDEEIAESLVKSKMAVITETEQEVPTATVKRKTAKKGE